MHLVNAGSFRLPLFCMDLGMASQIDQQPSSGASARSRKTGIGRGGIFLLMKKPIKSWMYLILAVVTLGGTSGHLLAVDFHVTTAQELQNALTLAAANGAHDTIFLTNGYYVGNFNFNSAETNNLTLQAEPGVTNTGVTIDGAGVGRSMNLSCSTNAALTVRGLTFLRNCGAAGNAALRIATGKGADVVMEDCRFISPTNTLGTGLQLVSGNNAIVRRCIVGGVPSDGGTGIAISGVPGSVSVQNCTVITNVPKGLDISGASLILISNCTFTGNSGGAQGTGAYCSATNVLLEGNTFSRNAGGNGSSGGGAYCLGTTVTLDGNTFSSNSVYGPSYNNACGGGIACSGTTVVLNGNSFKGNTASWSGGGASCAGTVTMTNNTFIENYGGTAAGGVACSGTAVAATNNTFMGNATSGDGGGVWCNSGTVTMSGNTFVGNSSLGDGGGLCNLSGAGTGTTLAGNLFKSNTGGGFYVYGRTVRLLDNLIVRNSLTNSSSKGGGVWVRATVSLEMLNNTISENMAVGGGGGVAFQVDGVTEILRVYDNIIWGNAASGNGADVHLAGTGSLKEFFNNNAHGLYGVWDIAANNLDVAPMFVDPVNGDYHLRPASLCINAGTNATGLLPATDLDGSPRIAGAKVDLGCYEFNTGILHPADANGDWVISAAEYNNYAAAWKSNQVWAVNPFVIPDHWVTRAGYLLLQGGAYHNDSSAQPTCWKPGL
jgi:hypothetical protein